MHQIVDPNFGINSSTTFQNYWKNEAFTDVTLATMDDQQIRAHRVILSSYSTFFNNVFVKNCQPNLLLYLKDISHKQLEQIIEFIYTGQCEVKEEELQPFMDTANDLKILYLMNNEQTQLTNEAPTSYKTKKEIHNSTEILNEPTIRNKDFDIRHSDKRNSEGNFNDESVIYMNSILSIVKEDVDIEVNDHELSINTDSKKNTRAIDFTRKKYNKHIENGKKEWNVGKFKCSECDYKSKRKSHLRVHVLGVHEGARFHCDICTFSSGFQSALIEHKRTKHTRYQLKCQTCFRIFGSSGALKNHMKVIHRVIEGPGNFECQKCDYKATHAGYLREHMTRSHVVLKCQDDSQETKKSLSHSALGKFQLY